MIDAIQAGYSSAKAAIEIAKGISALKTETAINQAVIDIQRNVLETQGALSAAQEVHTANLKRIDALEQEIVRLKDWSAEKQRYELKRYHPGSVARVLKLDMAGADPIHRLCAHCYDRGEKGYLNPTGESVRRCRMHRCSSCKTDVALGEEIPNDAPAHIREPEPSRPRVISDYDPYDRI